MNLVTLNIEYFPAPNRGIPIFDAQIYIGEPNTDPEIPANQKAVTLRQTSGVEVTVAQPVLTGAGGVPLYLGSPVQMLVDGDYSIKVLNKHGEQIYYVPDTESGSVFIEGTAYLLADLKAISGATEGMWMATTGRIAYNDGGQGEFIWDSSDQSAKVTADTQEGIYVAPDSDATGASGVWVRQHKGVFYPEWFGAIGGAVIGGAATNVDDTKALLGIFSDTAGVTSFAASEGASVEFKQFYKHTQTLFYDTEVRGRNRDQTGLVFSATDGSAALETDEAYNIVKDFTINPEDSTSKTMVGINLYDITRAHLDSSFYVIDNIQVRYAAIGVYARGWVGRVILYTFYCTLGYKGTSNNGCNLWFSSESDDVGFEITGGGVEVDGTVEGLDNHLYTGKFIGGSQVTVRYYAEGSAYGTEFTGVSTITFAPKNSSANAGSTGAVLKDLRAASFYACSDIYIPAGVDAAICCFFDEDCWDIQLDSPPYVSAIVSGMHRPNHKDVSGVCNAVPLNYWPNRQLVNGLSGLYDWPALEINDISISVGSKTKRGVSSLKMSVPLADTGGRLKVTMPSRLYPEFKDKFITFGGWIWIPDLPFFADPTLNLGPSIRIDIIDDSGTSAGVIGIRGWDVGCWNNFFVNVQAVGAVTSLVVTLWVNLSKINNVGGEYIEIDELLLTTGKNPGCIQKGLVEDHPTAQVMMGQNLVIDGTAPPTTAQSVGQSWRVGDQIKNKAVAPGITPYWVCTVASATLGDAGTWVAAPTLP